MGSHVVELLGLQVVLLLRVLRQQAQGVEAQLSRGVVVLQRCKTCIECNRRLKEKLKLAT